jgi:hypothetical protein
MRGVPVSLLVGSFLVLTAGVADAHRPGRGHGYEGCRGQDVERHHHRRHVEGRCHGPVSERHGPEPVSEGVKCRAHFGWRPFCSIEAAIRREHAICCRYKGPATAIGPIQALHKEIWQERENTEDVVEALHVQIQKEREAAEKAAADAAKATADAAKATAAADVRMKEAELKIAAADAKSADADKRLAAAQEALAAAGQISATATKAKQDADAAKIASDAEKDKYEKLNAALKSQQDALLRQAEHARHSEDEFIAALQTRWDQIFVNLRSVDPCQAAAPGAAGKATWDSTTPKAGTGVAAETESGKRETGRIRAEPSPAGARLTGMSERSQAGLD